MPHLIIRKRSPLSAKRSRLAAALLSVLLFATLLASTVQGTAAADCREIVIEIYVRSEQPQTAEAIKVAEQFLKQRNGVVLVVRQVTSNPKNAKRLEAINLKYRLPADATPVAYGCNQVVAGYQSQTQFEAGLAKLLRLEVYVRAGCSRCANAHAMLDTFQRRYPGLAIEYREVSQDPQAVSEMNRLVAKHHAAAVSVPVFHLCDQLIVGFVNAEITSARLDQTLAYWTIPCRQKNQPTPPRTTTETSWLRDWQRQSAGLRIALTGTLVAVDATSETTDDEASPPHRSGTKSQDEVILDENLELPIPMEPGEEEFDLPIGVPEAESTLPDDAEDAESTVTLPLFGELSVDKCGLTLLTIAISLVDGFNPCAMWVLLLLLSVLINLHDRWRILAVAGTFVLVSGLAYFAFMAAWLNVFLLVGYLRPIQIVLGLVAVGVGSIHVKDFFALHKGISFSIPDAAKPGIYAQTRRIVTAENLWGALIAAAVMAVAVNIVELLCTAGLPAVYTEILTQQNLPPWQNYLYLLLYNVIYMFDDALMVAVVVITLDKRKLQEREGRWLKLISGSVMVILGVVMLLRPDWLF